MVLLPLKAGADLRKVVKAQRKNTKWRPDLLVDAHNFSERDCIVASGGLKSLVELAAPRR